MSAPYFIRYSITDIAVAEECAEHRLTDALKVGATDGFGEDSLESHYHGALGEIAASRALHIPWVCHSRRWNKPDVGRYEVRAIGPAARPRVKTKDNDSDDVPILSVMLAVGTNLEVAMGIVLGWVLPSEVRAFGSRDDPGRRNKPAYFADVLDVLNPDFPELETA